MKRGADDGRWREANACVPVQCWGGGGNLGCRGRERVGVGGAVGGWLASTSGLHGCHGDPSRPA